MSNARTIRRLVLLCALACARNAAGADTAPVSFPDHPRFTVQRLSDEFGLGAVTVTAIGQDRTGFLWIGTQTGLYRYDGAHAQKMTDVEGLIGHYVLDLLIAPDGTPWFAGNRGIAYYKDGKFQSLAVAGRTKALASSSQIFAVDSKGVAYALLFGHGVLRVDPHDPGRNMVLGEREAINEPAVGIVRGDDDSIWFTYGTHLAHVEAGSNEVQIDLEIELPHERVVALLWDRAHTLWLRTATKLERLDPEEHKVTVEPVEIGPEDDTEGKPTLDQRGELLVPSSTGLYWERPNGQWEVVTDKQGLSSNDIQFAMEDREGTLWVGGSGTGLDRLPGIHEWTGWTTAEGLPDNTTWATQRDRNGRLWVSTARGVAVWDEKRHGWEKVPSLGDSLRAQVRQLQEAGDGAIWALTVTGAVVRIDPENFATTVHAGYRGRPYQMLRASPTGEIWATTRDHLVKFDVRNPSAEPEDVSLPLGSGAELYFLEFAPDNSLWISGTAVVYRYDGKNWLTLTMKDGLQGQAITSIAALSKKEAWVAYNDVVEVTRVSLDDNGRAHFENHAWDWLIVGHDSHGRVWFDGPDGLAIRSPNGRLQALSHADGLLWDDVSPWTGMREEKDGSYLIATSRGLARYRPEATEAGEKAINVVLTKVVLGGQERQAQETAKVKSPDGSLMVQFAPMILGNLAPVSCVYQLRGLETQPTETQQREVQYGGLPPGDYQFWVQCREAGVALTSNAATFQFKVLPSFWQTWWARVAGTFLLLGCFAGYVSLRTRALNRRRVELEKAVAERNTELMQKNKELEERSLTDPLTAARNRRYFYETISTDIAQATRSHLKSPRENETVASGEGQELIFVLVDIDRFKRVNDEMGHAAGDRLLQEVAKRIQSVMRGTDDLVRWGGEEFLLVCRTTDRENAALLSNRVLQAIRDVPFNVGNGVEIHKTCSIGWAPFPWLKEDVGLLSIENVIELADKALYLAKREGRNRSYGMVPAANVYKSEKTVSIESLRECPPDLVQIV
ncbi:MAG TPA: diguanylate cyclase [Candidatus Sulfotelmatobacter sp.]|nr:diguanylate cyclase [Candidatus Sulfotelmatobacter sp.]